MKNPLDALRRFLAGNPARVARAVLAVVGVILVGILLFADNPWDARKTGSFKVADYVAVWFWLAAAGNLLLVAGLFATARWWVGGKPSGSEPAAPGNHNKWWFRPLVAAAAVFLAATAWPRLGQSLWHDEANRVKNTLLGSYRLNDDGEWHFRKAKWEDTFFYYRMPNHTLQSLLSRLSHEAWLFVARPAGFPLSEAAMRAPILLVGMLGLIAMAVFLRAIGQPFAGVWAAWLLAVHPWYLRYASEARGYALVMALIPFLLLALLRALQSGLWRWWLLFGLAQAAIVYAYATSVYILVVLNLLVPFVISSMRRDGIPPAPALKKWLVTNTLSGALFLQFFLPCLPQFLDYIASEKGLGAGNHLNDFWMKNFLAHLLAGLPWNFSLQLNSPYVELMPWASANPGLFAGIVFLAVGLVALGARWCWAKGGFVLMSATVFILPAVLCYWETKARGAFLFEWYLIFVLPGLVALAALGGVELVKAAPSRLLRVVSAVFVIGLVPAYAAWTVPQRDVLMTSSIQPYREAVLLTRPSLDPLAPGQEEILTAVFHAGPPVYDPRCRKVSSMEEMLALMAEADATGLPLYLNLAYLDATASAQPELTRLANDPALFDEVAHLVGLHPSLSTRVLKYRPQAARRNEP